MNEFLEQFVVESRELVTQAVDGLLKLERSTDDPDGLDAVFRAFHTLKGGAGIVEFPAMERVMHAAEEVLGEARAGQRAVDRALVSGCLASLDLVSGWLERIAGTGSLPQAEDAANGVVRRFADLEGGEAAAVRVADWIGPLRDRHRARGRPTLAVRYVPTVDCFFQGEDPAARMAGLPQLMAQELAAVAAWPSLSELDPYACNLVLMALSGATPDAVRAHMQGALGECAIVEFASDETQAGMAPALGDRVRELLASQLALLTESSVAPSPARTATAGRVAVNVLTSASRDADGAEVAQATDQAIAEGSSTALSQVLRRLLASAPEEPGVPKPAAPVRASETTLRVDTVRIDALVRLTGELTTAKNALAHTAAQMPGPAQGALRRRVHEFERLIEELQQSVLALRVLPLRTVLQRFPRVVRDLSTTLGKPVVLQVEGDHTEADKAIVDMLFEPLLHALRNAIDHGVELPARRLEAGKPLVATIHIRARRDSDRVLVEVEDDGGGVDLARVRDVALKRGLVTAEALAAMSDSDIVDLVFAPGFSTAATVSELSGRGVGLDAVRTAIQRVGGQVALASRPGAGTTLTFSLPFSVMVTQVLTVDAGGQIFGVPLDALLETVRVPAGLVSGIGAGRVIVHRDRTLPLIDLAGELGGPPGDGPAAGSVVTVVVASVSDELMALRVDRVGERIEVILRPLEGLLAGLKGITGTTLLGDGRVLLVLDLWELLA